MGTLLWLTALIDAPVGGVADVLLLIMHRNGFFAGVGSSLPESRHMTIGAAQARVH